MDAINIASAYRAAVTCHLKKAHTPVMLLKSFSIASRIWLPQYCRLPEIIARSHSVGCLPFRGNEASAS